MSIVAPKGRKHLSANALFRLVRSSFATIPDERSAEVEIPLTDALMSAMVSYFNCTTGKVSHSVKDHTWSARPAAIAGVRFCHPPAV